MTKPDLKAIKEYCEKNKIGEWPDEMQYIGCDTFNYICAMHRDLPAVVEYAEGLEVEANGWRSTSAERMALLGDKQEIIYQLEAKLSKAGEVIKHLAWVPNRDNCVECGAPFETGDAHYPNCYIGQALEAIRGDK